MLFVFPIMAAVVTVFLLGLIVGDHWFSSKNEIEQLEHLLAVQRSRLGKKRYYSTGLYNGLELALSVLNKRPCEFISSVTGEPRKKAGRPPCSIKK